MKVDNGSLAIEIVYGAILETMGKMLRKHYETNCKGTSGIEFEAIHDDLAEAIESLMGLELRGESAAQRMERLVKDGCFENRNPVKAVWMLHEAIRSESMIKRLEDEIESAGARGAWVCASTRNVAKAKSVLRKLMRLREKHQREARVIVASANDIRIYEVGELAYAA